MAQRTCTSDGCDSPAICKDKCKKCYMRDRSERLKQQKCVNDGCENPRGGTGGYCPACYQRTRAYGDPNAGPPRRKRRRETVTSGTRSQYHVNHAMVRKVRGPAWEQGCEHCGDRAATWATKHGTLGTSPGDYMPLCWHCHAVYDDFAARLPDNRGSRRTPEQRERMRQAALARWADPAERERMSERSRQREARKRAERREAGEEVMF